ncbi:hypothetical protein C8T65DRAFT_262112 [Cerioporus squamosus]|nr:hypothetical protein C8T65DRAFT_262112 [Cerioporus squamosus]
MPTPVFLGIACTIKLDAAGSQRAPVDGGAAWGLYARVRHVRKCALVECKRTSHEWLLVGTHRRPVGLCPVSAASRCEREGASDIRMRPSVLIGPSTLRSRSTTTAIGRCGRTPPLAASVRAEMGGRRAVHPCPLARRSCGCSAAPPSVGPFGTSSGRKRMWTLRPFLAAPRETFRRSCPSRVYTVSPPSRPCIRDSRPSTFPAPAQSW